MTKRRIEEGRSGVIGGMAMTTRRRDTWRWRAWLRRSSACGRLRVLAALAGLALSGCAHGLVGSLPDVASIDGAPQIVVIRPHRFVGAVGKLTVTLDGADLYAIRNGEHVVIRVPPGDRIVGVKYDGLENTQIVTAQSGQTYYFRLDISSSDAFINRIVDATGRQLVSETARLQ
jgi:Protein of unknown function (DUF2846)